MKIVEINDILIHEVSTDDGATYRRHASGGWERLYGDSWEPHYDDEEIEDLWNKASRA